MRPLTLLIAALGGEGGGVMTGWVVTAARAAGLFVQATSIPGVAQRTGATTYYIEIWPQPLADTGERVPVLALSPAAGEVDILVASELLEAGRAVKSGLVTPDRTMLIASTHRVLTTREKMDPGDGRFDAVRLQEAVTKRSRSAILADMESAARTATAPLNAVMLGVLAGAGCLPMEAETLRRAVGADGRATEANLAGFDAGLRLRSSEHESSSATGKLPGQPDAAAEYPMPVRPEVAQALARLTDYQDEAYAALYLQRLSDFRDGDSSLLRSVARHLAVRMSYEDAIRVAQAKLRPARTARIRKTVGAGDDDILVVTDFFKPGFEEICDILPVRLARLLTSLAKRYRWIREFARPMEISPTSLSGYSKMRLIAGLRRIRRASRRYRAEQAWIEDWLDCVRRAATIDPALAVEIAECARMVRGYGDTYRQGLRRYRSVVECLLRPALAGDGPMRGDVAELSRRIAMAREAGDDTAGSVGPASR